MYIEVGTKWDAFKHHVSGARTITDLEGLLLMHDNVALGMDPADPKYPPNRKQKPIRVVGSVISGNRYIMCQVETYYTIEVILAAY